MNDGLFPDNPKVLEHPSRWAAWVFIAEPSAKETTSIKAMRAVLIALASYIDVEKDVKKGLPWKCWPSHSSLAADTGFSIRAVTRALAALQRQGLIVWRRTRYSNRYILTPGKNSQIGHSDLSGKKSRSVTVTRQIGHSDTSDRSQRPMNSERSSERIQEGTAQNASLGGSPQKTGMPRRDMPSGGSPQSSPEDGNAPQPGVGRFAEKNPETETRRDTPSSGSTRILYPALQPPAGQIPKLTAPPERYPITSELLQFLATLHLDVLDVQGEIDACLDHFRSNGIQKADWDSTIRQWFRNGPRLGWRAPANQPLSVVEKHGQRLDRFEPNSKVIGGRDDQVTFHEPSPENSAWREILEVVEKKINVQSFNTWFKPTAFLKRDGMTFYVQVPNTFFRDWLIEHDDIVKDAAMALGFGPVEVVFISVAGGEQAWTMTRKK